MPSPTKKEKSKKNIIDCELCCTECKKIEPGNWGHWCHGKFHPHSKSSTPSQESTVNENYARNYSHYHCWQNAPKSSPCGQPIEKHDKCCLCDLTIPRNPEGERGKYTCAFEITKKIENEKIKQILLSIKECCEKCEGFGEQEPGKLPPCSNVMDCPCHIPQPEKEECEHGKEKKCACSGKKEYIHHSDLQCFTRKDHCNECDEDLASSSPKPSLGWKKEFYKRFPINEIAEGNTKWGDYNLFQLHVAILDFISSALQDREGQIVEMVKSMKISEKKGVIEMIFGNKKKENIRLHTNMDVGYNQALDDIISELKKSWQE